MAVETILDARSKGESSDEQVLGTFQRACKNHSLRGFVAKINAADKEGGSYLLLSDAFRTSLSVVVDGDAYELASGLELVPAARKSWPKCNRCKLADIEK